MIEVNYAAVLTAAVAAMALGALWYSPIVFGKPWMRLMGVSSMGQGGQAAAAKGYGIQFFVTLVMAYVLAHFAYAWGATTVADALQLGFWLWLGFMVPVTVGSQLWEGKSWKLFFIVGGYQLISTAAAALIIVLWA